MAEFEGLLGHPIVGFSWEGFVAENIIVNLSSRWRYSYYRTTSQTEIDLVLEGPGNEVWAIEIKRSAAPAVRNRYHTACVDVGATKKFVIYSGKERYSLKSDTEGIGLVEFLRLIRSEKFGLK